MVCGNTNPSGNGMNGNVFDTKGICPTLTTDKGEGPKILDPITCAMRGRNPDNPSDRNPGIELEQRLELGGDIANCITTVQKDSLVAEPNFVGYTRISKGKVVKRHFMDVSNTIHRSTGSGGNTDCFVAEPDELSNDVKRLNDVCKETEKEIIGISVNPNSRKLEFKRIESIAAISPALRATDYKCPHAVWESDAQIEYKGKKLNEGDGLYLSTSQVFFRGGLEGISRTLKATNSDAGVVQNYRIRKLTPRECFRLMGVSEIDIDKIQSAGISKTQQYKMAGNSIVVDVLYYIFKNLFKENTDKTD